MQKMKKSGNEQSSEIQNSPGKSEDDFDDEVLCNICYYSPKDTKMVPCGHQTCAKCIKTSMQNS